MSWNFHFLCYSLFLSASVPFSTPSRAHLQTTTCNDVFSVKLQHCRLFDTMQFVLIIILIVSVEVIKHIKYTMHDNLLPRARMQTTHCCKRQLSSCYNLHIAQNKHPLTFPFTFTLPFFLFCLTFAMVSCAVSNACEIHLKYLCICRCLR